MMTQQQISDRAGISQPFLNAIINGKKRPSWTTAKRLCQALPGTTIEVWMEGTPEEIRASIENVKSYATAPQPPYDLIKEVATMMTELNLSKAGTKKKGVK